MILIDYNAVAISTFLASKMLPDEDSMRHMILNQIRIYRGRFQREYGEICVVADNGTNNFRREIFPQYKAKRKKTRNESKVDWNEVYRCSDLVRDDIRDNFPYKGFVHSVIARATTADLHCGWPCTTNVNGRVNP